MPSDFVDAGKRFEAAIPVPELQISSIPNRARDESVRHRSRVLIACAVAAIAVLGSGTVLAAMYGGVRIWLSGDKAAAVFRSFTTITNPTAEDLRRVTADATFPVVLPVGIPKGMHVSLLLVSPADHPNFILVQYRNSTGSSWEFPIVDSSVVNDGAVPSFPNGEKPSFGLATLWNVGRETVILRGMWGRQSEIKAAMLRSTPAESLAQTLPMLYRITILGGLDNIRDAADAIAPSEGRSVLVDRGNLGQVASLAREHKPLLAFSRTRTVDNLPIVSGKPDFAHQSSHSTKELTVSADGVRALAAVLASKACGSGGKMGSGFTCEILINERRGRAYWIWMLPLNTSTPPTKYIVDSATFRVEREK
ncbi:MAG: hypothetical protein ABI231_02070 [Candidatus Tumulicola sp.]